MKQGIHTVARLAALTVLVLGLPSASAWAGSKIFATGAVCTTLNCNAATVKGSIETNANGNRDPFVVQVFSSGGECLRLAVTSQGADLEGVVVSPDGAVWRNDDGGVAPCALCPVVKAITNTRGWHTFQLSQFVGAATNADFTLRIGRYPSGNVNCAGATVPFALEAAEAPVSKSSSTRAPTGDGAN